MDFKEIYTKNKYLIKHLVAILIFTIALIPMYFVYDNYNNYDQKITPQILELDGKIDQKKSEIIANENAIKYKSDELERMLLEKGQADVIADKYPSDDRPTVLFNTKQLLMNLTQNLDVITLGANEKAIIQGEIEQIPFILECRSTYEAIINVITSISQNKFIYVKDIEILMDSDMLRCKIEIIALAKKTNIEVPVTEQTPVETPETIILMRTNPFGETQSSNPIIISGGDEPIGPVDDDYAVPSDDGVPVQNTTLTKPVVKLQPIDSETRVVQDFNEKKNVINDNLTNSTHSIGLSAELGTKVRAVKSGKVIFVGKLGTNGMSVMILHNGGATSYYGNLGSISVIKGQAVSEKQIIGYVGGSGDLGVSHLKFGYAVDNKFVDPKQYLGLAEEVRPVQMQITETKTQANIEQIPISVLPEIEMQQVVTPQITMTTIPTNESNSSLIQDSGINN